MSQSQDYLRKVQSLAEAALVQTKAVMRCERHNDVLVHNDGGPPEHVVYNLASIWLKNEVGFFIREDLQDAIRSVLDRAVKGGCPECARLKDN